MFNTLNVLMLFLLIGFFPCYSQSTASLQINIFNETDKAPVTGGKIQLYHFNEKMSLISEKPVLPVVTFENVHVTDQNPYFIRIMRESISYSLPIWIRKPIRIDTTMIVYNSQEDNTNLKYSVTHWFVFIHPNDILFEETIEVNNPGTRTVISGSDSIPDFLFYLPSGTSLIETTGEHPAESIREILKPVKSGDNFRVNYPFRPGVSRLVIKYFMELSTTVVSIKHHWHYPIENCNLIIHPSDAVISGGDWDFIEDEGLKKKNYQLYRKKMVYKSESVGFEINASKISNESGNSKIIRDDNVIQKNSLLVLAAIFLVVAVFLYLISNLSKKQVSKRQK